MSTRLCAGVAALLALAALPAPALAGDADSYGHPRTGDRIAFTTDDRLVAADQDNSRDLYVRDGESLELGSVGPDGGHGDYHVSWAGQSEDGLTTFFHTTESLISTDTDAKQDVYRYRNGAVALMSPGTGAFDASSGKHSVDGTRSLIQTKEPLVPATDTDTAQDVYLVGDGLLKHVTAGATADRGNVNHHDQPLFQVETNSAMTRLLFSSASPLTQDDTDTADDVYEWKNDSIQRISKGVAGGNTNGLHANPLGSWRGRVGDGQYVHFTTTEKLTAEDTDSALDAYLFDGTTAHLWSKGAFPGSGSINPEGTLSLGSTSTPGRPGDIYDVFRITAAGPELITNGGGFFSGSSSADADGSVVFFQTSTRHLGSDTDDQNDIYRWEGGTLTHVTKAGNGAFSAGPIATSADGSKHFFQTNEPLSPQDTDTNYDIYATDGGPPQLITTGPLGSFAAGISGMTIKDDGTRALFETAQPLVEEDTDDDVDVYLHAGGVTRLVSYGPAEQPPRDVLAVPTPAGAGRLQHQNADPVFTFSRGAAVRAGGCLSLDFQIPIQAGAGTLSKVKLVMNPTGPAAPLDYDMTDANGDGTWLGTIGCAHLGASDLLVCYDLTENTVTKRFCVPFAGLLLIDPQGVVYDKRAYDAAVASGASAEAARASSALSGATVRLQRLEFGAFTTLLSGDPGIFPRVNPQVTGADGLFQWDVSPGRYRVVVERSGYTTQTSREVDIPPPVLDLHMGMLKVGDDGAPLKKNAPAPTPTPTPPAPIPGPIGRPFTPLGGDRVAPSVRACGPASLKPDKRRRVTVCLRLSERGSGSVAVQLGRTGARKPLVSLAAKRFSAAKAGDVRVTFTLTKAALRRLRRGKLTAALVVQAADPAGNRAAMKLPRGFRGR